MRENCSYSSYRFELNLRNILQARGIPNQFRRLVCNIKYRDVSVQSGQCLDTVIRFAFRSWFRGTFII